MRLYTTSRKTVLSLPPVAKHPIITMYCCGPTVYDQTHIGHIRKYVMDDTLKKILRYAGYQVDHVMNVTDVGHLTDDADTGEDKLEKGAKKAGKTVWEIAAYYTDRFVETMQQMHVDLPEGQRFCRATDNIEVMIETIQKLQENGHTYETSQAVYFSVESFPAYGALSGQPLSQKQTAVREEVQADSEKRHPADFALWFKRVGRFADHSMHWDSPWGDGFPGWHIECSAMAMRFLGPQLDIHTGGVDHIPVHHENEIAQSEGATGKIPFVQFWVHHAFLMVEGTKMSKSLGNFVTLDQIKERGIDPMALRLLLLQTHYRQEMNFTWEAAAGAQEAWERLLRRYREHLEHAGAPTKTEGSTPETEDQSSYQWSKEAQEILEQFDDHVLGLTGDQDLRTPQAVALLWQVLRSPTLAATEIIGLVNRFDQVFSLQIANHAQEQSSKLSSVPPEVTALLEQRAAARATKDWAAADKLRDQITSHGFVVSDGPDGQSLESL